MAETGDETPGAASLRAHLRSATMAAHDLLDHAMQAASGWQTRADYARFLALQHAARVPLEHWLAAHAPAGHAPPPVQTTLIAQDLALLDTPLPPASARFDLGLAAARGWIGAAWVLAGSALGNRAIARQVARIGGGAWPVHFLADDAMIAYWQALRTTIDKPAQSGQAEAATTAAEAVFAHFLAAVHRPQGIDTEFESIVA